MAKAKKTAVSAGLSAKEIAQQLTYNPAGEALTSPISTAENQARPVVQAKLAPVAESVEMSIPNVHNTATHRPDLLGHPYHDYLDSLGLVGLYTTQDMMDLRQSQGWRIFRRPANTTDEHPIFQGTDGDTVRRGELTLMVRPKHMQEAEVRRNAQAYMEEVASLQDEMKENARQVRSEAEGRVTVQQAEFPSPAPTDALG